MVEEKVTIAAGRQQVGRQMTGPEAALFRRDYQNLIDSVVENDLMANRAIAKLFLDYFPRAKSFGEVVLQRTKLDYEGKETTGDGLVVDILIGNDFNLPYFRKNIVGPAPSVEPLLFDGATGTRARLNDRSGVMIFGWWNPRLGNKCTRIGPYKGGKILPGISVNNMMQYIMRSPYSIEVLPESDVYAEGRFEDTGPEFTAPIGIKFAAADRLRDLTVQSPIIK